jgi:hypothetical protein
MTAHLRLSMIRVMAEREMDQLGEVNQPRGVDQLKHGIGRGHKMTVGHLAAVLGATVAAVALFGAMLFGWNYYLDAIGIHRSLRDVAIALWAFLLPSWFTVEEAWFAPKDPTKLDDFRELQRKARLTWTIVAGAVGIIIGVTAPAGEPFRAHPTNNPPVSAPSKRGNPPMSLPSKTGGS